MDAYEGSIRWRMSTDDHMAVVLGAIVILLLACFPNGAKAQNCEAVPAGPARTDCYLALSQFYRGQSDLAAAKARVQSDAAWYRAITGTDPPKHRLHRQQ
jgi:hypothetical protein